MGARGGGSARRGSFAGDGEGIGVQYAGDVRFSFKGGVVYGAGGFGFLGLGIVSRRCRRMAICVS